MSEAKQADAAAGEIVELEQVQVARAQAGDQQMLKVILARHSDPLFSRVILPRVGERAAAEDILEATLAVAIEKLNSYKWQGRSIYFWLRQIALNKVIDHHRSTQRGRRLASALSKEPELGRPTVQGPEAALIAEQEQRINRERIDRALAAINPRYRSAIEMRLIEELSREECARRLDVTLGTFDVLFFRALRAFRRVFGER